MNISGCARRNCSAMPLPMTPTVLTVLTSASTSASSRLPWASVIMLAVLMFLEVPAGYDSDWHFLANRIEHGLGPLLGSAIPGHDSCESLPGHPLVYQAFGHTSFHTVGL